MGTEAIQRFNLIPPKKSIKSNTIGGGVSVADVSFQESGNNTQFEIDNESGVVSRITLLGVTTDAFSVDGFNNDPDFGDVVFA